MMCSWDLCFSPCKHMRVMIFPSLRPPSPQHQEVVEQSSVEVNMHSCSNSKYFMECSWLGNLGQRTWPFFIKEFQVHVHFDFGLLRDIWTGSTSDTLFNSLYWALFWGMPPQAWRTYDENKAGKDCCFEKLTPRCLNLRSPAPRCNQPGTNTIEQVCLQYVPTLFLAFFFSTETHWVS